MVKVIDRAGAGSDESAYLIRFKQPRNLKFDKSTTDDDRDKIKRIRRNGPKSKKENRNFEINAKFCDENGETPKLFTIYHASRLTSYDSGGH